MESRNIGEVMKSQGDMLKDVQRGSTMTDGRAVTKNQPQPRTINIASKKQATWIRSKMQVKKLSNSSSQRSYQWFQIIKEQSPTGKTIEDNPKDRAKSPLEIWKMEKELGMKLYVASYRKEYSKDVALNMSEEDRNIIKHFSKPAAKETILAHLMKSTAHLTIKGTGKNAGQAGEAHTAFLLHDYTIRLFENEVKEVDLYMGLDYFIEHGETDFFPSYAKLHRQIFGKAEK